MIRPVYQLSLNSSYSAIGCLRACHLSEAWLTPNRCWIKKPPGGDAINQTGSWMKSEGEEGRRLLQVGYCLEEALCESWVQVAASWRDCCFQHPSCVGQTGPMTDTWRSRDWFLSTMCIPFVLSSLLLRQKLPSACWECCKVCGASKQLILLAVWGQTFQRLLRTQWIVTIAITESGPVSYQDPESHRCCCCCWTFPWW